MRSREIDHSAVVDSGLGDDRPIQRATPGRTYRSDVCDTYSPGYDPGDPEYKKRVLEVAGISQLFKALSDETRTRILYLLQDRELCVCDLADILGMTLPAISHHLRLLRTMRLVKFRREGKQAYYSLDDHHVVQLIEVAKEHFNEDRR